MLLSASRDWRNQRFHIKQHVTPGSPSLLLISEWSCLNGLLGATSPLAPSSELEKGAPLGRDIDQSVGWISGPLARCLCRTAVEEALRTAGPGGEGHGQRAGIQEEWAQDSRRAGTNMYLHQYVPPSALDWPKVYPRSAC